MTADTQTPEMSELDRTRRLLAHRAAQAETLRYAIRIGNLAQIQNAVRREEAMRRHCAAIEPKWHEIEQPATREFGNVFDIQRDAGVR